MKLLNSTTRSGSAVDSDLQEFEVDLHEAVMNSISGRPVGILASVGTADDRRFGMIIKAPPMAPSLMDAASHAR